MTHVCKCRHVMLTVRLLHIAKKDDFPFLFDAFFRFNDFRFHSNRWVSERTTRTRVRWTMSSQARTLLDCPTAFRQMYRKYLKMVTLTVQFRDRFWTSNLFSFSSLHVPILPRPTVNSMQKMVNQLGTTADTEQLRSSLYVNPACSWCFEEGKLIWILSFQQPRCSTLHTSFGSRYQFPVKGIGPNASVGHLFGPSRFFVSLHPHSCPPGSRLCSFFWWFFSFIQTTETTTNVARKTDKWFFGSFEKLTSDPTYDRPERERKCHPGKSQFRIGCE